MSGGAIISAGSIVDRPGCDARAAPAGSEGYYAAVAPDQESVSTAIQEPLCAVFRRRLKQAGHKYTPERARILDAIIRIDDIFDAETLQRALSAGGHDVSKATVYRTLKLLQDAGIIQQLMIDPEQSRWQLVYGRSPRAVLIRVDTDEITPIDLPGLDELCRRACADRGLRLEGRRLHIFATGD